MKIFTPLVALLLLTINVGCSTLPGNDDPSVRVAGIEPLPSEGLELRFALKLRVQNPNETPLAYNGMSVSLDLDGRGLASGVSDVSGEIPRFSDTLLTVPVSISAFSAFRQFISRINDSTGEGAGLNKPLVYSLRGKLGAAGGASATRFTDQGEMNLFTNADNKVITDSDEGD